MIRATGTGFDDYSLRPVKQQTPTSTSILGFVPRPVVITHLRHPAALPQQQDQDGHETKCGEPVGSSHHVIWPRLRPRSPLCPAIPLDRLGAIPQEVDARRRDLSLLSGPQSAGVVAVGLGGACGRAVLGHPVLGVEGEALASVGGGAARPVIAETRVDEPIQSPPVAETPRFDGYGNKNKRPQTPP